MTAADPPLPRNAAALAAKAEGNGWEVRSTFVRSCYGGKDVEHWAVRMRRERAFLTAFWENAAFRAGCAISPDAARLSAREVTALVMTAPGELAAALDALLCERRAA